MKKATSDDVAFLLIIQRFLLVLLDCGVHVVGLVGVRIGPVVDLNSELNRTADDLFAASVRIIRIGIACALGEVERIDVFLALFPGS